MKYCMFLLLHLSLIFSGYADPAQNLEKSTLPETTREVPKPDPATRIDSIVTECRRGGVIVAIIVKQKTSIGNISSMDTSYVKFILPDGTTVKRQIASDGFVRVNGESRIYVNNTKGSIGVISKDGPYCEIFMVESGTFLDGDARENLRKIMKSEAEDEKRNTANQ